MKKNNSMYGRLGAKDTDIKHFKDLLPLDVVNIVEPFCGSYAVSRIIYKDKKYKIHVSDSDLFIKKIFKNVDLYVDTLKKIKPLFIDKCDVKEQMKKIDDFECDLDFKNFIKQMNIIRGSLVKKITEPTQDAINFIKTINFYDVDAFDLLNKFKNDKNAFIFLDPPYLFSDNSGYKEQQENPDMSDYLIKILDVFKDKKTKAKIMLVVNDLKLTRYLFKDFHISEYNKIYQIGKKKSVHLIITNYTKPE